MLGHNKWQREQPFTYPILELSPHLLRNSQYTTAIFVFQSYFVIVFLFMMLGNNLSMLSPSRKRILGLCEYLKNNRLVDFIPRPYASQVGITLMLMQKIYSINLNAK